MPSPELVVRLLRQIPCASASACGLVRPNVPEPCDLSAAEEPPGILVCEQRWGAAASSNPACDMPLCEVVSGINTRVFSSWRA